MAGLGRSNLPLKPIFRWPGGKRWLVPALLRISALVPLRRYVEPFVGGGALFFALSPPTALLSDANDELITTYRSIRDEPDAVHRTLNALGVSEESYYLVRRSTPQSDIEIAARFLYLRECAFGGLYRVNRHGEFNVPYGGRRRTRFPTLPEFQAAAARLAGQTITTDSFDVSLAEVEPGDLVYADPPYISVSTSTETFSRYMERIFTLDDHIALAKRLADVVRDGAFVMATNSAHGSIRRLYPTELFHHFPVQRQSSFSPRADGRREVVEVVLISKNVPRRRSALRSRLVT